MSLELSDVFRAATLIQWGLQPRVRPIQNAEYRELVREYLNRSEFRDIVAEMSDGLGLYVLNVSEHGIVLSPRENSVFWMRSSEFRPSSSSTDTRLLDGLVEITIAATVFPRARDLEDDVNRPRPPVTVDEIDESLRTICARLKEEFANVDPDMDDVRAGLYDAWRVYDGTIASRQTADGRESRGTTTRIIKYNLERLKEFGCFTETRYAGKEAWQPTRRYNVLVQELAASRLYDELMRIRNPEGDAAAVTAFEDGDDGWGSEFRDDDATEGGPTPSVADGGPTPSVADGDISPSPLERGRDERRTDIWADTYDGDEDDGSGDDDDDFASDFGADGDVDDAGVFESDDDDENME